LAIARWNPNELVGLHSAMDRLFGDVFGETFGSSQEGSADRGVAPIHRLPVDIAEVEGGYRIQAAVPGFRPEDVEVTFSDGVLSISARRSHEESRQEGNYMRREIAFGNYERQIALPGDIRADQIKASFDNGILTIDVPRAPKPEPVRIEVKPGEQPKQLAGANTKKS
jgi:HSP20 family protein